MRAPRLLVAVATGLLLALPALAEDFPALTGRVVDAADVIPADETQHLEALLAAHERETGNQIVVATLPALGGRTIEETGVALGRHWQIGQQGKDNGVLLVVAPTERAVRIEVGYGLEGVLPDAIAKVIIESSILPRFRAGDLPGGIRRGAEDIVAVLSGKGETAIPPPAPPRTEPWIPEWLPILIIVALFVVMSLAGNFGAGRRRGYRSSPSDSGWSSGSSGGGFSGGGGSFGGGGSSGRW